MDYVSLGQKIKQQHPEYSDLSDEEVGKKVVAKYPQYLDLIDQPTSNESVGRYLEPQIVPALQTIFNIPKAESMASQEMSQQGPFAAPSPQLREAFGGTSIDTGNRFINSLLDAAKMTYTSTGAGANLGTGAAFIKALIPYLTYGGVNQLKDKLASQDTNAWTGKDIQASLVDKLTSGNKLGNVKSDVETIVNDLLTRRMPGGFSHYNTYTTGDINQLAKNIGQAERGGYDPTEAAGMVRSAGTSLIKDVVPATKFPYQVSTALSKIPGPDILKNPVSWPLSLLGGGALLRKAGPIVRSILGF